MHRGDRIRPPAEESAGSRVSSPAAATASSIAAHHEQLSNEQWQRREQQAAASAPLAHPAPADGGFPLALVLAGAVIPLGLAFLVGRAVLGYARHRRGPARVA